MGFRGGVKLTPPQRILVFKYPSGIGLMCILDGFFIWTSVMVALVHVYNLLSALNEQLIFLCSSLFGLKFEKR